MESVPVPPDFTLSVVVPVYNEARTLAKLVDAVRTVPIQKQIILVDDCSKDRLRDIMETFVHDDLYTFEKRYHDVNRGKGAANRTRLPRFPDCARLRGMNLCKAIDDRLDRIPGLNRGLRRHLFSQHLGTPYGNPGNPVPAESGTMLSSASYAH
ncbi:MAG: glycosyltransferase family 2 protein [Kiritimatiellae bacterium]|nr:glycosyltransferase family 2 protein [Kiritimatiellia bacterium]